MWNLKTNNTTYKTEGLTDYEKELMVARWKDGGKGQLVWDGHIQIDIFEMDNQQGHTVHHRELCSMLSGSLDGTDISGKWIYVYVWLSHFTVHLQLSKYC